MGKQKVGCLGKGLIHGFKTVIIIPGIISVLLSIQVQAGVCAHCNNDLKKISLDFVDGAVPGRPGLVSTGCPVTFHLRIQNHSQYDFSTISNGFFLYSPDGATWDSAFGEVLNDNIGDSLFDAGLLVSHLDCDGRGIDTIIFKGYSFFGSPGLYSGFDKVAYSIETGSFNEDDIGKQICLDSGSAPPLAEWVWSNGISGFAPSWDGPFCFHIGDAGCLVELMIPDNDTTLKAGDDYEINWRTDCEGLVVLYYSVDNGDNWTLIDTVDGDSSNYHWRIPPVASDDALIRLCAVGEAVCISSGLFNIMCDKPPKPDLNCSLRCDSVFLWWEKSPEAEWYNIYKNEELVDSVEDNQFVEKIENQTAVYQVEAGNVCGCSELTSAYDCVMTDAGLEDESNQPGFSLYQNFPNPFNSQTIISFSLVRRTAVKITIYNILGRCVDIVADEEFPAGEWRVVWDGNDSNGQGLSSGIYFYKIEADKLSLQKKMILIK